MSVLLAFGVAWLALAQEPGAIIVGAVLIGLGFGDTMPGYAVLVREIFAAGLGSLTAGWLRDLTGGYAIPFLVAAASAGLGAAGLGRLRKRLHSI
jgi:hypothetical protein